MKTSATLLMFALLSSAAGASLAGVHVHTDCNASCPPPPEPPMPPVPPAPPAPPTPPAPPAPPALPVIPDVPAAVHAACASKPPGTPLTWNLREGETMSGVCIRKDGRMLFSLRDYDRQD